LSDPVEVVLGEVWVSTRLKYGSERIRLLVTSSRIVVDHGGKRGPGAVAGTSIFGELSSGLEGLFKRGGDSMKKRKMDKMGPGEVLRAHKDNFAIGNAEVVNVRVEKTLPLNRITILTGDDKYEFLTKTLFDNVVDLFSKPLGDRMTIRKVPDQGSLH
jgi:hypothetical protein